jgi:prepilin-type N-terminal cleavage/methylation domain-containing protein
MRLITAPRVQRGFTLMEVSCAILISVAVIAGAVATLRLSQDHTNTVLLAKDEAYIADGAEKYFRAQCASGILPSSVAIPTLVSTGFLAHTPQSPWGATWSVGYTAAPHRVLVSAAVVASTVVAGEIGQETQAIQVSGTTLTWSSLVRLAPTSLNAYNLLFQAMYESPSC